MGGEDLWRWCGVMSCHRCRFHAFADYTGKTAKMTLRQMRKTSLEACFNSNLRNIDKDLQFCRDFFKRKKTSWTDEQQKVVDEWEEIICGDGAGLCPAIEADFARFALLYWKIVKMTCDKCKKQVSKHVSGHVVSNADNDLGFGRNFFRRRKDMLTE